MFTKKILIEKNKIKVGKKNFNISLYKFLNTIEDQEKVKKELKTKNIFIKLTHPNLENLKEKELLQRIEVQTIIDIFSKNNIIRGIQNKKYQIITTPFISITKQKKLLLTLSLLSLLFQLQLIWNIPPQKTSIENTQKTPKGTHTKLIKTAQTIKALNLKNLTLKLGENYLFISGTFKKEDEKKIEKALEKSIKDKKLKLNTIKTKQETKEEIYFELECLSKN